jgi:hypothetical protein
MLVAAAQRSASQRFAVYQQLAGIKVPQIEVEANPSASQPDSEAVPEP